MEGADRSKRRRLRRTTVIWLSVVAAPLVVLALWLTMERLRGHWHLRRWREAAATRGLKLTVDALLPPAVRATNNAYADLSAAIGQLRAASDLDHINPPLLRGIAPGKAMAPTREVQWQGYESQAGTRVPGVITWELLAHRYEKVQPALALAREALQNRSCSAWIDYSDLSGRQLMHLGGYRTFTQRLWGAIALDLHFKRLASAQSNLLTVLRFIDRTAEDRIVGSQLVRITSGTIAVGATWEALQTEGWSDEQLAELQSAWRRLDFLLPLSRAMEMERAMATEIIGHARESERQFLEHLGGDPNPTSTTNVAEALKNMVENLPQNGAALVYQPVWRYAWSEEDEALLSESSQGPIEIVLRNARLHRGETLSADEAKSLRAPPADEGIQSRASRLRYPFAYMLANSGSRLAERGLAAQVQADMAVTAIALTRYRLAQGRWPESLADLVPTYLPSAPRDLFDGAVLRYRAETNGWFTLYSVGRNRKDDGGDPTPLDPIVMNFPWFAGKDVLWPRPMPAGALLASGTRMRHDYTVPLVDLAFETNRQIVVDREPGQYLGHPSTVLLEDGKTILCVYPKGHGKGAIVYKRSADGGRTWSERLPTPATWATSLETPTIHRIVDAAGKRRLLLWSGRYPARRALSEDDGQTWTELEPVGEWGGIVVMGFTEPLKTPGHYLAMFHDDGRYFSAQSAQEKPVVFTLLQTTSQDGGLTWATPTAVLKRADIHLCEPGLVRSPDGRELAVLLRENSRRKNSHVIFSQDEGRTWSDPRELPGALTGDRHVARYAPDGRLLISFRDTTLKSPTIGDWVAWIGTYEDILRGSEGQYRVRLMKNYERYDCAYPAVELLPDGTFVATTYGHWETNQAPYIVSVRLKLPEIDQRAQPVPRSRKHL